MFCFCFLRASAPIFFISNSAPLLHLFFCWWGRNNTFCPWTQGIGHPSYATGGGKDFEKFGQV